ncbi:MAG: DUF4956 domain-containing protein [Candidatus Cloacimonetes bacterium]|nr:DUF4956 domain-containing protein [Candidatus Cloacimonadota bacterium]
MSGPVSKTRLDLARSLVGLCVTTTMVISVIKSSLALSLGLVGALSIIRFRTAVRDPEELSFIYLAFAIGIGLGANQKTLVLACLCILLVCRSLFLFKASKVVPDAGMLRISYNSQADCEPLLHWVRNEAATVEVESLDVSDSGTRLLFAVTGFSPQKAILLKEKMGVQYPGLTVFSHQFEARS